MSTLKRILVGLDLSEMDSKLIAYTAMFAKVMQTEVVYFIHINKNLELPEEIKASYPDLLAPVDETIKHEINLMIKENWDASLKCEVHVEVKEGNPADKIVRWTRLKQVDLMIMGKKVGLSGSGIVPKKIAKLMTTSILFVPEEYEMRLKTVFVPIDFSRFSGRTLHQAQQLCKKIAAKLIVQYVYRVPTGYHKTGKSFEEFAQIMRTHAEKDMQRFFKTHEIENEEIEVVLNLDKSENAAQKIYETALNHKADLIIMSSKGRTGLASVLIGSVTEKLIDAIKKMPLLIAKDEKENISFIDALFKI